MTFIQVWANGYWSHLLGNQKLSVFLSVIWSLGVFQVFHIGLFHLRTSLFNLNPRHSPVQTMSNASNTASVSKFVDQSDF